MSQDQDDVLELLDSIDKPKNQTKRKERKTKKRHNEDLMEFLDEITSEGTPQPEPAESKATDKQSKPLESVSTPTAEPSSEPMPQSASPEPSVPQEQLPDPLSAVSSWWSKASPGLWEQASKAASKASETFKQGEQHIQRFDLANMKKSLSTFVEVIVPPITRHEQLTVHIFHDMSGYPSIDDLVRSVFERVMDQVEGGGDLNMVVQKGAEHHTATNGSRNLHLFEGTLENANKLCLASIEDFRRSHQPNADNASEETRLSEIFISLQAVIADGLPADNQFQFACCMSDFTNNVHLSTSSQAMPTEWATWLDGGDAQFKDQLADPREWVLEWVEESIGLALGTLAQKYVLLRMGLGTQTSEESK